MSISTTSANDTVTGRNRNSWTAGCGDQAQSETFRALAWSQADDSLAEPLPYRGEDYQQYSEPEADSRPTVRVAGEIPEPPSATRRSTLLYGIAAGFVAAAIGGLVLSVLNTDDSPVTISPKVTQPTTNVVKPQPHSEATRQAGPIRASSPAPVQTAGAPVHAVPSVAAPSRAFAAPAPELQTSSTPEAAAPEVAAPELAPEVAVPEMVPPESAAPEFTAPDAKPPVWVPPVISTPVVSVPEVTPQPVPHPVGPLNVPVVSDPIQLPTPSGPLHVPVVSDPVIPVPAAPPASNPVITLKPGITIPTVMPNFSTALGG